MVNNELISIVVPVYNVEKYIEKCVNSITNQVYNNLEIILVNDGSTDNSGKLCDSLSKLDDRIKVYHKENGGLSDARNYGVERANGKYIGFVDSDDFIDSDMYKTLYDVIKRENADVAECNMKIVYPNSARQYTTKKYYRVCNEIEYIKEYLVLEKIFGSVCTKLIKSEIAKTLTFPKGKLYEDTFYHYDLLEKASKYVIFDIPFYNYMMRENSITNNEFNKKMLDLIEINDRLHSKVYRMYPTLKEEADCRQMYAYFSVLNRILLVNDFKKNKYYAPILSYFKCNFKKLIRNRYINKNRKLALILILINTNLYKKVLVRYKNSLC